MPDEKLLEFLNSGKDWERKQTSIPGVFLLRLPALKGKKPSVFIEVNPVDSSGAPIKKRGVIIRSGAELAEIRRIVSSSKMDELMKKVDEVNPEQGVQASKASDVYEI